MASAGIPIGVMFDVGPEAERKKGWREEGRN